MGTSSNYTLVILKAQLLLQHSSLAQQFSSFLASYSDSQQVVVMPCGKTRVQRKVEELVASTLEAKAAAPCKALKRRVCQRARKKLAHMLPQEEFEKVVVRLKGEDAELEIIDSTPATPQTPPQHLASPPMCMQVPIIAVPVLVPLMAPRAMTNPNPTVARSFATPVPAVTPDDTPRTQCGNFEFQVAGDSTPEGNCFGDPEGPTSFYNFIDDFKVEKQVTGSTEPVEWPAELEFQDVDSDSDATDSTVYRNFQRHMTMPVERTFIHFNTREASVAPRRRSKSV
eukprot:s3428_g8.t1